MSPWGTDASPRGRSEANIRWDDRAVSKVVGVVLMVAIVIALSAVVAGMVSGFSGQLQDPAPQVAFEATYYEDVDNLSDFHEDLPSESGELVALTHDAGDHFDPSVVDVVVYDGSEEIYRESWEGSATGQESVVGSADRLYVFATDPATLSDKRIWLVWGDGDGQSSIVLKWEGSEVE